jgi:hypothetical protein
VVLTVLITSNTKRGSTLTSQAAGHGAEDMLQLFVDDAVNVTDLDRQSKRFLGEERERERSNM